MSKKFEYSDEFMREICSEYVGTNLSMDKICSSNPKFPCSRVVWRWIKERPEAEEIYLRCKETQMHFFGEEVVDISDLPTRDRLDIDRNRLRVDTRLRMMSNLNRAKYGNATDIKVEELTKQLENLKKIVREKTEREIS